jgi:hypothetical protein
MRDKPSYVPPQFGVRGSLHETSKWNIFGTHFGALIGLAINYGSILDISSFCFPRGLRFRQR